MSRLLPLLMSIGAVLGDGAQFPVARAEPEFRELVPFVRGWGTRNTGNITLFREWIAPYGPLDLHVKRANYEESRVLRNVYLGVAASAFEIDPVSLLKEFHCGEGCIEKRKSELKARLVELQEIVKRFRVLPSVEILAVWGEGDLRVNSMFRIQGQENETEYSPEMGFLPSGVWRKVASIDNELNARGSDTGSVMAIVAQMRRLHVTAMIRDEGGAVRVIHGGVATNEAGLLFSAGSGKYEKGQLLSDGRRIVFVEAIAAGVTYYETI